MNVTPTAARCWSGLVWSTRFGLTTAQRLRQARLGRMVVDHDHLETDRSGMLQGRKRSRTGIEGHHEAAATARQLVEQALVRTVAVQHPVGDQDLDLDA